MRAPKINVLNDRLEKLAADYVANFIENGQTVDMMRENVSFLVNDFSRQLTRYIDGFERSNKYPKYQ